MTRKMTSTERCGMKVSMKQNTNHIFQQLWFPVGWTLALTVNVSIVRQVYFLHKFTIILNTLVTGKALFASCPPCFVFHSPPHLSATVELRYLVLEFWSALDFLVLRLFFSQPLQLVLIIYQNLPCNWDASYNSLGFPDDLLNLHLPPPHIMRLKH